MGRANTGGGITYTVSTARKCEKISRFPLGKKRYDWSPGFCDQCLTFHSKPRNQSLSWNTITSGSGRAWKLCCSAPFFFFLEVRLTPFSFCFRFRHLIVRIAMNGHLFFFFFFGSKHGERARYFSPGHVTMLSL